MQDTINEELIYSFKYMTEIVTFALTHGYDYKVVRNGNFLTIDLSFATWDCFLTNTKVISALPKIK